MTDVSTTSAPTLTDHQMMQAKLLAASDLVPGYLRNKPANVYLILQYADALGIHPAHALSAIQVISGKVTLSSELMRALVLRAGHRFHIIESTEAHAVVEVARREYPQDVTRFEFTMVDAAKAGLAQSDTYKRHPKAMLLARVTSMSCRAVFADLLAGVSYDPDEIRDVPELAETRIARHTDNTPAEWEAEVVDIRTGEMLADAAELDEAVHRHPANGKPSKFTGVTDDNLGKISKLLRDLGVPPGDQAALISRIVARNVEGAIRLSNTEAVKVIHELNNAVMDLIEESTDD